jgi:hypothetical protein
MLAANEAANCQQARGWPVCAAADSNGDSVRAVDGGQLLKGWQRVNSDAATQHNSYIETIACRNVRYGKRRAHSNVLDDVEFRDDGLRTFGEKQETTIGRTHQKLMAPSIQALQKE